MTGIWVERRKKGLSAEKLAGLVGVAPSSIRKWERKIRHTSGRSYFRYRLYDGVYDLTVKYFDKLTGEYLNRERLWLVMLDGDLYQYNEEDMNAQYVLYTAFIVGGAAA